MADSRLVGLSIRTGSTIPNDGAVVSRRISIRTNNRLANLIARSCCLIADSYGLCTRSFSTLAYSHRGPISAVGIGSFSAITDGYATIRTGNLCICTYCYAVRSCTASNICTIAQGNRRTLRCLRIRTIAHYDTVTS